LSTDPSVTEYQPLTQSLFDVLGPMMASASTAEQIAKVVYAATTDTSGRRRVTDAGNPLLDRWHGILREP
jgi:hypothetical protein